MHTMFISSLLIMEKFYALLCSACPAIVTLWPRFAAINRVEIASCTSCRFGFCGRNVQELTPRDADHIAQPAGSAKVKFTLFCANAAMLTGKIPLGHLVINFVLTSDHQSVYGLIQLDYSLFTSRVAF